MDRVASDFVLQLNRASRRLTPPEFAPWVFRELERAIAFDSAMWARGALVDGLPQTHAHHLDRQPEALLAEYFARAVWRDDLLLHDTLGAPGRAIRLDRLDRRATPRLLEFTHRNGQAQAMAILRVDAAPQVLEGLSLYRRDETRPFDDRDANLLELLAPHVFDAWRENGLQQHDASHAREFRIAVLAPNSVLTLVQDGFAELLVTEWPEWQGPSLPAPLQAEAARAEPSWWQGERLAAQLQPLPDGCRLLRLRPRHAIDALAPRKREVALLFAAGATQSEVATRLNLSPSTVNNYLLEVYRALDIANKSELALLAQRLVPS